MNFFSFDTKFNLKIISIFSLAVAMIYFNAPFFEGEPEPDFSRFMSHLIYLEEDGSTILYSDGKSDALTIVDWALYDHQVSTQAAFHGVIKDKECPFLGITNKRIRENEDIISVLEEENAVLVNFSKCSSGMNQHTKNDYITFTSAETAKKIAEYHFLNQEFSIFLVSERWWWSSRFNREINSQVTRGLLEKDPRNFCRVWTELLYVPADSQYAWGPLKEFLPQGEAFCIPKSKEAL